MAVTKIKQRKLTRMNLVALLTLLALLVPTATAFACPVTNLADLEDEVMCVVCGTPLGAAGGPQAERQRDFIRQRVDSCKTKDQIKLALVAEYGDQVLALPPKSGFNWAIYAVPVVALAVAASLLLVGARRWRLAQSATNNLAGESQFEAAENAQGTPELDADMNRYDL